MLKNRDSEVKSFCSFCLRAMGVLQDMHKDNKKIVAPMFQRGKSWNKKQEKTFIDSLIKGYPVGTMLFYETFEVNKRTYILVDGLQRGNSIKKYMTNPTKFEDFALCEF